MGQWLVSPLDDDASAAPITSEVSVSAPDDSDTPAPAAPKAEPRPVSVTVVNHVVVQTPAPQAPVVEQAADAHPVQALDQQQPQHHFRGKHRKPGMFAAGTGRHRAAHFGGGQHLAMASADSNRDATVNLRPSGAGDGRLL
ncbi:hypothetical protein [Streptomyces sp. NPDC004528]|uniref:hypothetical protein n=1 Tax=Streptomyces sp. NPDC004528 TaxID=3154550 RepID=UPI0033B96875